MELDPIALKAAVGAALRVQLRQEVDKVSDFDPAIQNFKKAIDVLSACDNHTFVLVSFSLLSRCIEGALSYNLRFASKRDRESLLEGLGPLSTDSARIRLIKALGWLPDRISSSLNCMRQERNRVAHGILKVEEINLSNLVTSEYRSYSENLKQRWLQVLKTEDGKRMVEAHEDPTFWVALLAYETTLSVVYAPARQKIYENSTAISLSTDWAEMPAWEKDFFAGFVMLLFRAEQ